MAMPGNTAETFLVHFFGTGLADDRYVVERFKARADGDIVPAPAEALAAKGRRKIEAHHGRLAARRPKELRPDHYRDHHLHRPQDPRRLAGFGVRSRPAFSATASRRADGSLPGRPAGPAPAGRPSVHFRIGRKEAVVAYRDIAKRRQKRSLSAFIAVPKQRRAAGLCLKCGKVPPAPDRTLCEPCLKKRRAADRARSARLRAEGKPRRDPERAKRYERERSQPPAR